MSMTMTMTSVDESRPPLARGQTRNDDLMWAAALGDLDQVKALVGLGFDPQEANYDWRTPLHLAASEGYLEICTYLIEEAQVDPSPKDRWGHTPCVDATLNGHSYVRPTPSSLPPLTSLGRSIYSVL